MNRIIALVLLFAFVFLSSPAYAETEHTFPSAENVLIDGVAYAGGKITGKYDYVGVGDIPEGESSFQWFVSDFEEDGFEPITGETSTELVVNEKLLGKYIMFEVTPVGEDGTGGLAVPSKPVLEQSVPESFFDENFSELDTDISDGDGWVLSTGGGNVDVNNGYLELVATGTSSSTVGAERRFPALSGIFSLDFTFKMSKKQVTNLIFAYETGAYVFNISADANNIGVYVGNDGFDSAKRVNLLLGYQPDTEYHMNVLVNTDTDRLSISINDELKLENAFFRKDVTTGVDKILTSFSSNENSNLLISRYSITRYVKSPDLESVLSDAKLLALDIENGIEDDLILPDSGENGSTIRWESSNPEVISDTGKVNRSTESDIDVILTAYLQKGSSPEIPVIFNVKVLQFIMPAPEERIKSSLDALELPKNAVTEDLTLNTQGDFDVVIQWQSSNDAIISTDGKITRPLYDTYVTLTARATAEEESDERNFTVLVKGSGVPTSGPSGSSGSGGGGGSSKKKSSPAVYVPPAEVQPTTEQKETSEIVYSDLKDYEWAEDAIMYLTVKGVVKGTGESTFEPQRSITREELVHIIVNAFNLKAEGDVEKFSDVKESWYEQSVLAAKSAGLVMGKGDNTFGVGEFITREDAAAMLYRILKMKDADMYPKQDNTFEDNDDIADYAVEAVDMLWTNDIIKGSSNGYFYPRNYMNRAEASTLLYKAVLMLERG